MVETRVVSYSLANLVMCLMASELFAQRAYGMEPCELHEYLATHIRSVLEGKPSPTSTPRKRSTITDEAARSILRNGPRVAREHYEHLRKLGRSPRASLNAAARLLNANADHD